MINEATPFTKPNMIILVAADSFKDALPADAVCQAIARGLEAAGRPYGIEVLPFPMADGGEGTAEILTKNWSGWLSGCQVRDPLGRPVKAHFGLTPDRRTAIIDMAQASGLSLLAPAERDPLRTTTYGTGELILHALEQGAEKVLLGIGGSATNDAGMGMATALGYRFYDAGGNPLAGGGQDLEKVARIDDSQLQFDRSQVQVEVLCDVDNPLYGGRGAAHVYAPQKGASPAVVEQLDRGLRHFAEILKRQFGQDFASIPGAGAAGGLGAGAMAFLGASLRPGTETIIEQTGFLGHLPDADLVITGEGKLDGQTLNGKLIHGICQHCRQAEVPVIALCGTLEAGPQELERAGLTAAFSILQRPQSLAEAIRDTERNLESAAFNLLQAILACL